MRRHAFIQICLASIALCQPYSQITKVIDLLRGMKTQVDSETQKGAEQAEAVENQCIADITQLEGDIKYSSEKAETAAAAKEDGAAKAAKWAAEANALVPQIADAEQEKAEAKKLELERVDTFNKEEAELTEAVTMLGQAYAVIKRSLVSAAAEANEKEAFLQKNKSDISSTTASTIKQALAGVSAVISSLQSVSPNEVRIVESFVQDDLSFKQPQATSYNYESRSSGILNAIQSMQDKASEQLTKLREAALKAKHEFETLSQDLTAKIELFSDQMSAAKANSAEAAAASEKAAATLADTEEALKGFQNSLSDTHAFCDKSAAEWEARKTEALEESATLQLAVDVLEGKFAGASLLQVTNSDLKSREDLAQKLRTLGQKFADFNLLQAAVGVEKGDPFVKVRKMINAMINKLEEQQAAEAAKEAKCQTDLAKGKMDVKVKVGQLKKLQARADKANAKVAQLGVELQELADQIRLLEASKSMWTKNRNSQRQENLATVEEAKTSIEALNSAIGILTDFYGGGAETALVQVSVKKMSDKGEAIIEILRTAQNDFEKLRQTTEEAEAAAQKNYEKEIQDADVSLAKARALVEGKTSEQAAVKIQISQIDEDLGNAQKAWEAATKFLSATQEACANKPMTYEERQSKRQNEIEGLRTAMEILSA